MPTCYKTVVAVAGVASGGNTTFNHGLNENGAGRVPDEIRLSNPLFSAVATSTQITLTNNGSVPGDCHVIAEYHHSIERLYAAKQVPTIVPARLRLASAAADGLMAAADKVAITSEANLRAVAATLTAALSVNSQKVTDLAAPTADNDAARKKYVDDASSAAVTAAAAKIQYFTVLPQAPAADSIHAAYAGNNAVLVFPGPITNPDVPRQVKVTFDPGWDGGDVIVEGTGADDQVTSWEFTSNPGATEVSAVAFKTVTGIQKTAVGATANAASVGTTNVVGIAGFASAVAGTVFVYDNVNDKTYPQSIDANGLVTLDKRPPDGGTTYTMLAKLS